MSSNTDQDLTFIHFWKFPIQPSMGVIREIDVFSTVNGPVIHDWEIRVGPDTFGAFRGAGARNRHVQLRLRPAMFRDHIAEATKCTFQLKVRDRQTGQELLTPEPCTVIPPPNERTQGFKVPPSSSIGSTLIQVYQGASFAGRLCEVTTTITISQSQFRVTEWELLPPSTPLHLDWRFRLLDDKSTHDFLLVCRDGQMYTSKEALYFCSPYFREYFNGTGRDSERMEFLDVAVEAARTVVTFMVTSTFSAPPTISPSLSRDIFNLGNRFDVMQLSSLMVAVERLGYMDVIENSESMDVLIEWFVTAHECHMNRVQNAAVAYLTALHQSQYIAEYGDGEVPKPRAASERLNRGHGGFRTTPHQRVLNAQFSVSNVRNVQRVEV
ncbi:unnamed protein product [Cylicocyclus nassatus]|uniref:BTB domain-containing protein n=1 Tax=Cylicocyclus nassatus TaxID=53992 RepID=A0AA36GMD8_CYLNA|nr:unnamed protein product [Cylicocyclus nassatus]